MNGGQRTQAKVIGIFLLIFVPYGVLIAKFAIDAHGAPLPRWFPLFGLAYLILGIWVCIILSRKLFNKALGSLSSGQAEQSRRAYGRPNFPPLTLGTVYVSSVTHLEQFKALPWYAKQLGRVPDDFPFVTIGARSVPLVYFRRGELTLNQAELKFVARQPVISMKAYFNLKLDLQFGFTPDEILSVTRFDMRQATSAPVRLPFVRVCTARGNRRDFLVCSRSEDLSAIARETEDLFCALQSFAGNQVPAATPI